MNELNVLWFNHCITGVPLTDKDIIQCYRIDKLFFIDLTNKH